MDRKTFESLKPGDIVECDPDEFGSRHAGQQLRILSENKAHGYDVEEVNKEGIWIGPIASWYYYNLVRRAPKTTKLKALYRKNRR